MSKEATDFILRPVDEQQAEYAAAHKPCKSVQCAHCWPSLADDFNAARAHKTPAPAEEGKAEAGAGQTSATPALSPRGVADTNSPAADVEGASASGAQTPAAGFEAGPATTAPRPQGPPRWSAVDDERADLLDLLANEHPEIPSKAEEWETFVAVLKAVAAEHDGEIDQNETRPRLHGQVSPQRVGPMFRRARREGLIEVVDYTVTANSQSGNVGRPAPSYRWLGAAS